MSSKNFAMKTIAIADQRRSATSEDHAALDCDMRLRNAAEPLARAYLIAEDALHHYANLKCKTIDGVDTFGATPDEAKEAIVHANKICAGRE